MDHGSFAASGGNIVRTCHIAIGAKQLSVNTGYAAKLVAEENAIAFSATAAMCGTHARSSRSSTRSERVQALWLPF